MSTTILILIGIILAIIIVSFIWKLVKTVVKVALIALIAILIIGLLIGGYDFSDLKNAVKINKTNTTDGNNAINATNMNVTITGQITGLVSKTFDKMKQSTKDPVAKEIINDVNDEIKK